MKGFLTLFQQELYKLLHHASTYFIAALFFTFMGFNFVYILFLNTQSIDGLNCLQSFFEIFWLPTLFIVPLITMRTLSEDQRSGLLESFLSTPISTTSLILSKFLSIYLFYVTLWIVCLSFPIFTQNYLYPDFTTKIINTTTLYGGLLFILSSSFLFIAIGIFSSSLTKIQSLAGFLAFCFLFILLVGFKSILEMHQFSQIYTIYIDFFETLNELCDGLWDVRPFVFHLGCGSLFLLLTSNVIENKTLR